MVCTWISTLQKTTQHNFFFHLKIIVFLLWILRKKRMKSLFKHSKAKTPVDLVKHVRDLLIYVCRNSTTRKCERKCEESRISDSDLRKSILEMRTVLFGDGESEPSENACKRLTEEFFREDTPYWLSWRIWLRASTWHHSSGHKLVETKGRLESADGVQVHGE